MGRPRTRFDKVCIVCQSSFSRCPIIEGKRRNLYIREKCLNCQPFNKNANTWKRENGILYKFCSLCQNYLIFDEENFIPNISKKSRGSHKCRKCEYKNNRDRHNKRKSELVDLHGSSCRLCGYEKYIGALEFHHINPAEKDKNFRDMIRLLPELAAKELEKCILVCTNCHREIHGHLHDEKNLFDFKYYPGIKTG